MAIELKDCGVYWFRHKGKWQIGEWWAVMDAFRIIGSDDEISLTALDSQEFIQARRPRDRNEPLQAADAIEMAEALQATMRAAGVLQGERPFIRVVLGDIEWHRLLGISHMSRRAGEALPEQLSIFGIEFVRAGS